MTIVYRFIADNAAQAHAMNKKVEELYKPSFKNYNSCFHHVNYDTLITLRYINKVIAKIDCCCDKYKENLINELTSYVSKQQPS